VVVTCACRRAAARWRCRRAFHRFAGSTSRSAEHSDGGRSTSSSPERSVGSVGDSYDNALAESINGLYKTDVIRRFGPWRSLEAVEHATLNWVHWFNNERLFGPTGFVPPAERSGVQST